MSSLKVLKTKALEKVNGLPNLSEKLAAFKALITPYLGIKQKTAPNVQAIKDFIGYVVDSIGESDTSTSKPLLLFVSVEVENIEEDYNDQLTEICKYFMDRVKPKYSYFSESLIKIAHLLAALYQADEDWINAGRVMASIDTDDQYYASSMSIIFQCEWRIETAEYFLQNEDNTSATKHIQKCRKLMRDIPISNNKRSELDLRYKTCYSRILDSERKFLAASINYLEIAQLDTNIVTVQQSDLLLSLENAVTCAILAKAGGPRTRVLAMLHRDERSKNLKNYKVLNKMHKNMILNKKEQDDFSKTLSDHHQATLAGGLTVLQKAVYEHNMLAAAKIYKNIKIEELAKLLGVTELQAEDLARIMIQEGRMNATIDQVDGIIEFDNDQQILNKWDIDISESLMQVNDIVDMIESQTNLQFSI